MTVPLIAQTAGDAGITIRLAHADGLDRRAGAARCRCGRLRRRSRPAWWSTSARTAPACASTASCWRQACFEGATVSVGVSQSAAFDVPSMLMTLDRYPYGCAEQTTSRALPLLYVSELAAGAGMKDEPELKERIQDAIWRVLNYQSSSGSFGLWGPGSGDLWLDSYVSDFLTRAREKGYDVPAQAMSQALSQPAELARLRHRPRGPRLGDRLCALRARPQQEGLGRRPQILFRHAARGLLEPDGGGAARREPRALRRCAALGGGLHGRPPARQEHGPEYDWYRSDYGSKLRDGAAMLALAAESRPMPSVVPELIKIVSAERAATRWTSTQDDAWMLLAARALQAGNAALQLTRQRRALHRRLLEDGDRRGTARRADRHRQHRHDADPGGGDDGRRPGAAAAGRRRRLHHLAHLLPNRRQRSQCHRGQRRTSASWSCCR